MKILSTLLPLAPLRWNHCVYVVFIRSRITPDIVLGLGYFPLSSYISWNICSLQLNRYFCNLFVSLNFNSQSSLKTIPTRSDNTEYCSCHVILLSNTISATMAHNLITQAVFIFIMLGHVIHLHNWFYEWIFVFDSSLLNSIMRKTDITVVKTAFQETLWTWKKHACCDTQWNTQGSHAVIFINHIPPGLDLRVKQILKSILISTVAWGNKSLSTFPYASS